MTKSKTMSVKTMTHHIRDIGNMPVMKCKSQVRGYSRECHSTDQAKLSCKLNGKLNKC